jgi:cob(I)alamin adenosyltransferase
LKIYTRTGDEGETGLFGGGRVPKSHARIEALGAVDELNAAIGWAVTQVAVGTTRQGLESLQHELFALGAEIGTPSDGGKVRRDTQGVGDEHIVALEDLIDLSEAELPELRAFVLPGGSAGAAALHLARTVCRRAERAVVRLGESEEMRVVVMAYLNRLSDLLFTLARLENQRAGRGDVEWRKG